MHVIGCSVIGCSMTVGSVIGCSVIGCSEVGWSMIGCSHIDTATVQHQETVPVTLWMNTFCTESQSWPSAACGRCLVIVTSIQCLPWHLIAGLQVKHDKHVDVGMKTSFFCVPGMKVSTVRMTCTKLAFSTRWLSATFCLETTARHSSMSAWSTTPTRQRWEKGEMQGGRETLCVREDCGKQTERRWWGEWTHSRKRELGWEDQSLS